MSWHKEYIFWLQIAVYIVLLLAAQSVGTILGDLYFDNGGNSKWLSSLLQIVGFPVLIPFLFISPSKSDNEENSFKPSVCILVLTYVFLGLLLAACSMLYSLGLKYLPVSTYSLVCSSQLTFNAIFSVLFNKQKITLLILNSLVLLTISSILLVIQNISGDNENGGNKSVSLGIICTVVASAGYSLMLSLTELAFRIIFRKETFKMIIDMSIYQSLVATLTVLIGFFASGDWKRMETEMEIFKGGKTAYVMIIFWTAMSWQVYNVGCLGLILKVSSLFSNAIGVVGYPLTPVLAVIFLDEKVTGVKVISLLLAFWGLVSYLYQNYVDHLNSKEGSSFDELPQTSTN